MPSRYHCVAFSVLVLSGEVSFILSFLTGVYFGRPTSIQQSFQPISRRQERETKLNVSMYDPRQMSKNFYAILGVSTSATSEEIKRSYRILVKKYHPDSNPDVDTTDKFQELNRAYEVLSDPFLKKKYDTFGSKGVGTSAASDHDSRQQAYEQTRYAYSRYSSQGSQNSRKQQDRRRDDPTAHSQARPHTQRSQQGGIPWDQYANENAHKRRTQKRPSQRQGTNFGFGQGMAPDFFDGQRKVNGQWSQSNRGNVGEDLHMNFEIDFERAIFGGRETVQIEHLEGCESCKGKGTVRAKGSMPCEHCGGSGFTIEMTQTPFGPRHSQHTCRVCRGSGKRIAVEACSNCGGAGNILRSRTVEFNVPAGIEGYTRIKIRGEGHAGPNGGPAGDLFIFLKVKKHALFHRDGSTVHSNHTVDYIDAILGNTLKTRVIDGKKVDLTVSKGTQHDELIRLPGYGAKSLVGAAGTRGEHCVSVKVAIPTNITQEEEQILLQLKEIQQYKSIPAANVTVDESAPRASNFTGGTMDFGRQYLSNEFLTEKIRSNFLDSDYVAASAEFSRTSQPESSVEEIQDTIKDITDDLRFATVLSMDELETSGVLNASVDVNGSADASSSPWGNAHTIYSEYGEDELSPEEVTQAWIEENMAPPRTRRVFDKNSTSEDGPDGKFEEDLFSIFRY